MPNVHIVDKDIVTLTYKDDDRTIHTPGSNFWTCEDGFCVEIEFQARKHDGHPFRQKMIRACSDPWKAKRLGRKWKLTGAELKRWDREKTGIMNELVGDKMERSEGFREWLLATGDRRIVEFNWWHDQEWGSCTCPKHFYRSGKNILGKIHMAHRDELVRQISS